MFLICIMLKLIDESVIRVSDVVIDSFKQIDSIDLLNALSQVVDPIRLDIIAFSMVTNCRKNVKIVGILWDTIFKGLVTTV